MSRRPLPAPLRAVAAAVGIALAGTGSFVTSEAYADGHPPAREGVIATGLDNPRQLSVRGHRVYVAEAGRGGDGPCVTGPEGEVCFGRSGAITEISGSRQRRIVTGLPSTAGAGGGGASGPADVAVHGRQITAVLGLGLPPDRRDDLGPEASRLGTVVSGRLGSRLRVVADAAAYENGADPDGGGTDSNPTGMVETRRGYVVVDAGGNSVVALGRREATIAVLPERMVPGPGGASIPMESVPTDVAIGPDGAYYVSELTGFPFPPGAATIWRIVPGRAPTAYATGLTNVTSLAWRGRQLYAVQIADGGLPNGPVGSLRKVVRGAGEHPAVVSGLPAPYGLAIQGRTAYVTTGAMMAGGGEVRAIPLR